jgi:glycosyltransferase involved in cell wall biosynthesis
VRISYLSADFGVPPLGTKGASVHVRGLVSGLAAEGHEVLLLCPQAGSGGGELVAAAALRELPLEGPIFSAVEALREEEIGAGGRLSKDLRNLLYNAWLPGRAAALLGEFGPDFIYERYSLFGTAGLELAASLRVPLILEVNAPLVEEQAQQRGLSLPVTARRAQRLVVGGADHVVVVSPWLRSYVVGEGAAPTRVTVIPNAADPDLFAPRSGAALRRRLGWEGMFVAGFVGSMKSWHGLPTLLEALRLLGAPRQAFRLLLVGDGPDLRDLQALAQRMGLAECIHATGAVPYREVAGWMAAMDAGVAPYAASAEGYFSPVKLFEYMAAGLPVVAARLGATESVIDEGRNGWLYPPGDEALLARRLEYLAAHRAEARRAGEAARRQVLERHTWRHNARAVCQIAELAIAQRRGAPLPA